MKNNPSISNQTKHIITTEMPYINLDSPHVKEQIEKGNRIIRKIKKVSSLEV